MKRRQTGKGEAAKRSEDRAARLAEALRANLKRRKAQSKARDPAAHRPDGSGKD